MQNMLSFPNPVNEKAARTVAAVVLVARATLATGWYWLMLPIAYGFWARVGPYRSEAQSAGVGSDARGRAATGREALRCRGRRSALAQGIGAVISTAALVLGLILGLHTAADVLLGLLVIVGWRTVTASAARSSGC